MLANFGRCRYCGKQILWVKMRSGRNMPCNPEMIGYRKPLEGKGQELIVTTGGETVWADRVYDDNADGIGYISHFATCEGQKKAGGKKS